MEIFAPFGPCIGRLPMPSGVVALLNAYTEEATAAGLEPHLDHGPRLVGAVTQEITLLESDLATRPGFDAVARFLETAVTSYIQSARARTESGGDDAGDVQVRLADWDMWIVRQFAGDYNPVHNHSNYHVSGVGYLKVPPEVSRPRARRDKKSKDGALHFVHGAGQFLCEARHLVRPVAGCMLLFPSHLMHTVYPFSGNDERRSFAFNVRAGID